MDEPQLPTRQPGCFGIRRAGSGILALSTSLRQPLRRIPGTPALGQASLHDGRSAGPAFSALPGLHRCPPAPRSERRLPQLSHAGTLRVGAAVRIGKEWRRPRVCAVR